MRRKLLAVLLSTACVLLAAGCGAVGSETAAPTEEAGEAQEDDSQSAEAAESAETEEPGATEGEETADSEEQEAVQEESDPNAIIWYMDEEGMKSGELGMMLRLDSEKRRELSLSQYMYVFSEEMGRQQNFECGYYDGSLDNYIAENAGFEKAMLDDCEYAYHHEDAGATNVVFVGNGVIMTGMVLDQSRREGEDLSDYLSRVNIKTCDEFDKDCLVYLTPNGLYSPALGLTVTYNEEGDQEDGNQIAGQEICGSADEGSIVISHNGIRNSWNGVADAKNAQEAVDSYVKFCTGPDYDLECTELEGTIETQVAGYEYLGRGCTLKSSFSWGNSNGVGGTDDTVSYKWLFASDDISWKIWVDVLEETEYETCLSFIEAMQ
mgnify:CR=1 FL=1